MPVQGTCDPAYAEVREEFERNFEEREEVGASVCVTVEGKTVVDLWGGQSNNRTGTQWTDKTVSVVFSSTKGATAICAHMLAARGQLDLDAPVAQYWPEFAQSGKETIPVRMLLNHQAGLPAVRKKLPAGAYADWDRMVKAMEEEEPFWEPGTANGYHAITFGWLVGEVVRRVSGKSLGTFFKEEIADPLHLDFWIGLPEEKEGLVAPMIPAKPDPARPLFQELVKPGTIQALTMGNNGGYMGPPPMFDSREAHAAEIGGAGGITNARGLAGMYEPLALGGTKENVELVNKETLHRMGLVASATGRDAVLVTPTRFSLGFMKAMDNRREPEGLRDSVLISEDAFGHVGAGGSFGFADPKCSMSFGYTMNRMGPGLLLNERGQSLVDAVYRTLGYTSNRSGAWA